MNLRLRYRTFRLYYRSFALFYRAFRDWPKAGWFPFFGAGDFSPRAGGAPVRVPRELWTMLPMVSRLLLCDARPEWRDGELDVSFGVLSFSAPPRDKSIATSLREIFIEDVYRLHGADWRGQVVLDVGANIGDSSIAFAQHGAVVHAFEPLPYLRIFLEKNIARNRMQEKIIPHAVGLSNRDETVDVQLNTASTSTATVLPPTRGGRQTENGLLQKLQLVDAVPYLRSRGITHADVLKLDCEGCEYALFENDELLEYLKPRRIIMEYHRGGHGLCAFLQKQGYDVDWREDSSPVGYIYANRTRP
jgi:FkbM family methyltransferase